VVLFAVLVPGGRGLRAQKDGAAGTEKGQPKRAQCRTAIAGLREAGRDLIEVIRFHAVLWLL
jgi:hypothetical protein